MAEVYKGIQEQLDRLVAVKVLHPFLADEEGFVIRFQREARIVATLRHQNIVQVYDFDEHKELGIYYMVMEYIDGLTLKDRLSQGPIPPDEAAKVGAAIADALDYAHQRDMVHRDIKPANIMFTADGHPVLTDFGIAKMMSLSGLTASGAMVGTPAYMAPEVGMGKPGTVAADIYSLGVVLYQMVTGQLPFESDSPMGMVMQHINDIPPLPTKIIPDLPRPLEAIIIHALEKEQEKRFGSAGEMASALRYIASGKSHQEAPTQEMLQMPKVEPVAAVEDDDDLLLRTWTSKDRTPPTKTTHTGTTYSTPREAALIVEEPPTKSKKEKPRFSRRLLRAALVLAVLSVALAGGWIAMGHTIPAEVRNFIPSNWMAYIMPADTPTPYALPTPTSTLSPTPETTPTATPSPTNTPTTVPTETPTPMPTGDTQAVPTAVTECIFRVQREDVNIEPDDIVAPGTSLVAYVPLRNIGNCDWPTGLQFTFATGTQMDAPSPQPIKPLVPEETTILVLPIQAPEEAGNYEARWEIRQSDGTTLGNPIVIAIEVREDLPTPTPTPKVTMTEEPEQQPLTIVAPEIVTWREDVVQGVWYATVRFQATGGEGDYRYYRNEVRQENLSQDGTFSLQMRRCTDAPLTVWVTSGSEAVVWDNVITYPDPDKCQ
ncbi:MAG: protein kinase [Anaerolineae bacterium]|nr:protein kinase [Anaerolineae bacterium]